MIKKCEKCEPGTKSKCKECPVYHGAGIISEKNIIMLNHNPYDVSSDWIDVAMRHMNDSKSVYMARPQEDAMIYPHLVENRSPDEKVIRAECFMDFNIRLLNEAENFAERISPKDESHTLIMLLHYHQIVYNNIIEFCETKFNGLDDVSQQGSIRDDICTILNHVPENSQSIFRKYAYRRIIQFSSRDNLLYHGIGFSTNDDSDSFARLHLRKLISDGHSILMIKKKECSHGIAYDLGASIVDEIILPKLDTLSDYSYVIVKGIKDRSNSLDKYTLKNWYSIYFKNLSRNISKSKILLCFVSDKYDKKCYEYISTIFDKMIIIPINSLQINSDGKITTELPYHLIENDNALPKFIAPNSVEKKESASISIKNKKAFLIRTPSDEVETASIVSDFISACCTDLTTKKIYITLYRTAKNSRILSNLIFAAFHGVQVRVYVELDASGNEEQNFDIFSVLSAIPNVKVYSGFKLKKVHAKMFIAVQHYKTKKDKMKTRYRVHVSTGNYNENTIKQYLDLQYFSQDESLAKSLIAQFENFSDKKIRYYDWENGELKSFKAPIVSFDGYSNVNCVKHTILQELDTMIGARFQDASFTVVFKCNHLLDSEIIQKIKELAQRGNVAITLIVRTTIPQDLLECEGINVIQPVGKYLEHDRFYYFEYGKTKHIYISSADLMYRNLYNRAETMVLIDKSCHGVIHEIIKKYTDPNWKPEF